MGAYLSKPNLANVPSRTLGLWRTFKEATGYCSMKWPFLSSMWKHEQHSDSARGRGPCAGLDVVFSAPREGVCAVAPEAIDRYRLKQTDEEIQRKAL